MKNQSLATDATRPRYSDLEWDNHLARLATFPEQNPNPVIETDVTGNVTYLNPAAGALFPELISVGPDHELLSDLPSVLTELRTFQVEFIEREIDLGDKVFQQRICYIPRPEFVRIYAHDVTALRRAERTMHGLARKVILAQEEERARVSRELHDEAGQALVALKISLQILQREPNQASTIDESLHDAIALVEETREHVRNLAYRLHPPSLDSSDLNDVLDDLCRDFGRRTGLGVQYAGPALLGLSDAVRLCLYRALQEALTNVAVHASASKVDVSLYASAGEIRMEVTDDGKGFDPDADDDRQAGMGLIGMRERVEWLAGEVEIGSGGDGTSLAIRLPRSAR